MEFTANWQVAWLVSKGLVLGGVTPAINPLLAVYFPFHFRVVYLITE